MGVRVDEARRHDQPVGIDGALGALGHLADLGHLAAGNGDIGLVALGPGAIDHSAVPDHEIIAHEVLPRIVSKVTRLCRPAHAKCKDEPSTGGKAGSRGGMKVIKIEAQAGYKGGVKSLHSAAH